MIWDENKEVRQLRLTEKYIINFPAELIENNAIAEAKEGGAEIISFPETVVLGWVNPEAHKRAYPIPGKDSEQLCGLAKKYKTYLCVGLAEKDRAKLYDSTILVDNKGEIILKHRKINILSELMTPPYTASKEIKIAETKFGRIGLLICADTHKDEILNQMAALEPDILLIPYGYAAEENNWPKHGKELAKVVRKTARKTCAVVIGTNSVGEITNGPWKGRVFGGQSIIADKNGKTLAIGSDRDRDIKVISIKIGISKLLKLVTD